MQYLDRLWYVASNTDGMYIGLATLAVCACILIGIGIYGRSEKEEKTGHATVFLNADGTPQID